MYVQTPGIKWITTKTLEPPNNVPILNATDKNISPI
jgi:hypothetical protein